jgi:hypothetical protein
VTEYLKCRTALLTELLELEKCHSRCFAYAKDHAIRTFPTFIAYFVARDCDISGSSFATPNRDQDSVGQ